MRTRPEIEKQNRNWLTSDLERLQIEIWLDIRDLLQELVTLQSLRDGIDARGSSGVPGREPPLSAPPAK